MIELDEYSIGFVFPGQFWTMAILVPIVHETKIRLAMCFSQSLIPPFPHPIADAAR